MARPRTSWPCSFSSAAAREESTPPDIATTTRISKLYGLSPRGRALNPLPRPAYVALLGAQVAHREPEHGAALELRVGQVGFARRVDRLHHLRVAAVLLLGARSGEAGAEADDRERRRSGDLEAGIGFDQAAKQAGEPHVLAEPGRDAFRAEGPDHHPQLERAESAAEAHAVVHQVRGRGVLGRLEVLRQHAEGPPHDLRPPG